LQGVEFATLSTADPQCSDLLKDTEHIAMDNLGVLYRDCLGGVQDSKKPPTAATRPAVRTAGVSPKITPKPASGTKRLPMPATQMRSKRSLARTQSSNAYPGDPGKKSLDRNTPTRPPASTDWRGVPAWITGP
jgi:hypothetical protein